MERLPAVRAWLLPCITMMIVCGPARGESADGRVMPQSPLTIAAGLETSRPMTDQQDNSVFYSPDGRRYVIMLIRGDIARDGVVATLMGGDLDSLESAGPRKIAEFFTRALRPLDIPAEGGSFPMLLPGRNAPLWIDQRHVLLYWEDERSIRQLVSVDVQTHEVRFLTRHRTPVTGVGVGRHGGIIFSAMVLDSRERSRALLASGFAVQSRDVFSLINGDVAQLSLFDGMVDSEYFLISSAGSEPRRIVTAGSGINLSRSQTAPTFSPDGRWAIVELTAEQVPAAWHDYKLRPSWLASVREYSTDPRAQLARGITQHYLVEVSAATARPLWNAPLKDGRVSLSWSPDSRSVLVGPSPLPLPQTDAAALAGNVLAEINVSTGEYRRLPVPADIVKNVRGIQWSGNRHARIETENGSVLWFQKTASSWTSCRSCADKPVQSLHAPIRIELRQDMNTPPAFYAVDVQTGRERLALDPNPQLSKYSLGQVATVRWEDPSGQPWAGRLYHPVGYEPPRRYPLVVQTYGVPPESEFSLSGNRPGLGPGWASRMAQQLANRGVMVLQVGGPVGVGVAAAGTSGLAMQAAGREAGIESLVARGVADRTRVGIEGFSYLGRQVEYSLAFSDFPYAAAIINDHGDNNYLQSTLNMSSAMSFAGLMPFGPQGLEAFLENSPAWNAERVRTPVQLIVNGPGRITFLFNWELFARLRYLQKPVEMFVAPDMDRGNHTLQNPHQVITVQQRNLDWWLFWLKDEEDFDPSKAEQYEKWRRLRALHDADHARPRPPLYDWTATPVDSVDASNTEDDR